MYFRKEGVKVSNCTSCNKKILLVKDKNDFCFEQEICGNCYIDVLEEYAFLNKEKFNEFLITYTVTSKLTRD